MSSVNRLTKNFILPFACIPQNYYEFSSRVDCAWTDCRQQILFGKIIKLQIRQDGNDPRRLHQQPPQPEKHKICIQKFLKYSIEILKIDSSPTLLGAKLLFPCNIRKPLGMNESRATINYTISTII